MKIEEAIQSIRSYCSDIDAFTGKPIDPKTTRDQVLYGERFLGAECTGTTLHLRNPYFPTDIRFNYEKYWYPHGGAKESEQDKIVCELMIRF